MVHALAIITAHPGLRGQILEAVHANAPAVLAAQGCIEYATAVDSAGVGKPFASFEPDTFVVLSPA